MNASMFFPKETHEAIAWLGKQDWLEVDAQISTISARPRVIHIPDEHKKYIHAMFRTMTIANDYFMWLMISKWFSNGPKVFKPSMDQCLAMENIKLNMHPRDYAQPFPCLMILLPKEYIDYVAEKYKARDKIVWSLCYHDHSVGYMISASMLETAVIAMNIIFKWSEQTIEEGFEKFQEGESPDFNSAMNQVVHRVCMNSCLLLSHFDREVRPADPKTWAYHRTPTGDPTVDAVRRKGKFGDIQLVELKQEIFVREVARLHGEHQGGTHASPKPHWRKGHWAMQAHGPARSERKRIFRAPVMVCAERFSGDLSKTQAEYVSK